jgi:hypothetical protein
VSVLRCAASAMRSDACSRQPTRLCGGIRKALIATVR